MSEDKTYSRKMTPVRLIESDDSVKVVFLESARFYPLSKAIPELDSLLATLRRAIEKSEAVEVGTKSIESDVIKSIKPAN